MLENGPCAPPGLYHVLYQMNVMWQKQTKRKRVEKRLLSVALGSRQHSMKIEKSCVWQVPTMKPIDQ